MTGQLYKMKEAADKLGLSVKQLRRLIKAKKLPYIQYWEGGPIFFEPEEIDKLKIEHTKGKPKKTNKPRISLTKGKTFVDKKDWGKS
jgi:predicted site-specific integrase-resolvase